MLKTFMGKCSLIAVACSLSLSANAVADTRESLAVPAGDLVEALKELARQSDIQLIYQQDQLKHLKTEGLNGSYSPQEAIGILLRGTPLRVYSAGSGAMVIAPASTGLAVTGALPVSGRARVAQVSSPQGTGSSENLLSDKVGQNFPQTIDEVIVTAQKREERLQDVPISISVLTGDRLDKSTFQGVTEALKTVPGVSISTDQNDSPRVTVRGVSAGIARFGGSGVAGYYLDTIPFALVKHAIVPDSNAYDLERVEVLRGPQGTLYGASALNGVLRVLTKDANPDAFEFKARASTSNTEDGDLNYGGDMAVNVPLVEGKLAARAVVGYQDLSGWVDRPNHEDANDSQTKNLRLKVDAQPTEELSVGLHTWLSQISRGSQSQADDNGRNANLMDEPNHDDYDAYGLKVGYEFPSFSLVSMTSHMDYHVDSTLDATPYGFPISLVVDIDADLFSQEFLLSSTHSGPWKWSIGAMYRDAEDRLMSVIPEFSAIIDNYTDLSESYAAYGQLTRTLFDGKLELTGGVRYFEDEVQLRDELRPLSPSSQFDSVSPRAVLTWHPGDGLTVYSSYAEGFRSGSQQDASVAALGVPATAPDTLKNYELGAKGSLLKGRFGFDVALYYMDWQDVQQTLGIFVDNVAGRIPSLALINSGSASGLGFDLHVTTRPAAGLSLAGSISWNDLTFDAAVFSGGDLFASKGDRLNNSPELSFGVSADYVFPLGGDGFEGQLSASMNHVSKQLSHSTAGAYVGDPISIGRVSFSVQAPEHWAGTLYIDNVSNENDSVYVSSVALESVAPPPSGISYLHTRPRPRTVGLQLEYRF